MLHSVIKVMLHETILNAAFCPNETEVRKYALCFTVNITRRLKRLRFLRSLVDLDVSARLRGNIEATELALSFLLFR